ncbi:MAG TPA: CinA family protein [Gammaproteobacteria bacterium]|nr:CinA family protein [Gammaproteobacteria bacterium]
MNILALSSRVGEALLARGWQLATAESCTGGAIAAAITDIAGSSQWFDRGFVTYSNQSKQDMLGVRAETLHTAGAVSEATVVEMVSGALARSQARVTLAVSGIAGPGGGSAGKPVGTVCLAWVVEGEQPVVRTGQFAGDRAAVRAQTVECALQGVLDMLTRSDAGA